MAGYISLIANKPTFNFNGVFMDTEQKQALINNFQKALNDAIIHASYNYDGSLSEQARFKRVVKKRTNKRTGKDSNTSIQ